MAVSLFNMQALPLASTSNICHRHKNSIPTANFSRKFPHRWPEIGVFTTKKLTTMNVTSQSQGASSSSPLTMNKPPGGGMSIDKALEGRWREIHGENKWAGLLDPMDPLLRSELTRYGEMSQACYDAFDFDPYSKYCGSCKYPRDKLFVALEMEYHGYEVTRYLYATSNVKLPNFFSQPKNPDVWSKTSNWIGFVAVSSDEMTKKLGRRDIVICWRGTVTRVEWVHDWMVFLKPITASGIPSPDPNIKVESGFLDLYTDKDPSCRYSKFSVREQVLSEVKHQMEVHQDEEVSITTTGHSLGSALATLSAFDIADMGLHIGRNGQAVPVSVFSFAGPRVGNMQFKDRLEGLGVKVLRVVNVRDVVPKTPGMILNENAMGLIKLTHAEARSYIHVGVELELDQKNSPYLKDTDDAGCCHDLEGYLHLLDGYHGKGKKFELATGRDIALVNKSCDFLKDDEYLIPPAWQQERNKGMTRGEDGRWILAEQPLLLDDHPDHTHDRLKQLGLAPPPPPPH